MNNLLARPPIFFCPTDIYPKDVPPINVLDPYCFDNAEVDSIFFYIIYYSLEIFITESDFLIELLIKKFSYFKSI